MMVIIAENTPDCIRGVLKRWFLEPKANIFVGSVNPKVRKKVLEYVYGYSKDWHAIIFSKDFSCQGFRIDYFGKPSRLPKKVCGLQLIAEKHIDEERMPF